MMYDQNKIDSLNHFVCDEIWKYKKEKLNMCKTGPMD